MAAVFAASFGLSWLCLLVPTAAGYVTPIWLPNATLLAILMRSSRRRWRGFVAAGCLGQILADLIAGSPPPVATVLSLCNTAEALVCASLMLKTLGRRPNLARPRTIGLYAAIAAGATLGSAVIAAIFLSAISRTPGLATFATWVGADLAALLIVAPCLVLIGNNRAALGELISRRGWPLALLVVAAIGVFTQDRYPLTYMLVAILLLTTWRLGMVGAAVGVLAMLAVAGGATAMGHGPFALMQTGLPERVLALQLFLVVSFYLSVPVAIQATRARRMQGRLVRALEAARDAGRKYRRIADGAWDVIVQTDRDRTSTSRRPAVGWAMSRRSWWASRRCRCCIRTTSPARKRCGRASWRPARPSRRGIGGSACARPPATTGGWRARRTSCAIAKAAPSRSSRFSGT